MYTFTYDASLGANITFLDGGRTVHLVIPPGALPNGTVVTIYRGNPAVLGPLLPAGQTYIDSYAVSWRTPAGTSPDAALPLVLSVADPAVTPGSTVYVTNRTGVQPTTATVAAGSWSVSFSTDPGYVAAVANPSLPRAGLRLPTIMGFLPAILLILGLLAGPALARFGYRRARGR